MTYNEIIENISNNLAARFAEVWHSVEIIKNDKDEKFPAASQGSEWISLVPTDTKETVYIRRAGDDEVLEYQRFGSCTVGYKMRSPLRIVYFKDHAENQTKILFDLMQSVLIGSTKLKSIIRDKFKLLKEESSGDYNLGPTTAYFAIDIYANWDLQDDTCAQDFCCDLDNPLKKCLVTEES